VYIKNPDLKKYEYILFFFFKKKSFFFFQKKNKGTKNIIKYVVPFYEKYVVAYSCKYKLDLFKNYCAIVNRLDANRNKTMEKEELIELIKLVYLLNPEGKGKQRKRTLEETLEIINDKLL
jgi:hypothetical protein